MSKFSSMALETETPERMVIQHPKTGQPLRDAEGGEAWIDLLSSDSEVARVFDRKITNMRLKRKTRTPLTAEELEAEGNERLAVLTKGWRLLSLSGAPLDPEVPCSAANAAELYADPSMAWLREQVMDFVTSRANFSPSSSKA